MATKKKKAGKRGRKPDASSKSGKIRNLLASGMKPMDIAAKVGCAPALVYNVRAREAGGGKRRAAKVRVAKAATSGNSDLSGILVAVKNSEAERAKMRGALEKIQAVIADALS